MEINSYCVNCKEGLAIFNLSVCMCVCVIGMCTEFRWIWKVEMSDPLEAGVTGNCELLHNVGVENQTQVPSKSTVHV